MLIIVLGFILFRNYQQTFLTNRTITDSQVSVIAQNLDTPWAIVFLPDKSMLITERPGRVRLVDRQGDLQEEPVAAISDVQEVGEGGLLGIDIHPNFSSNNYVYLYYTFTGFNGNTLNRVVRMVYKDSKLNNEQVIIDNIPGSSNHNGGRIKFGPDGYLYITTGDAENPSQAQNTDSLAGKILRIAENGEIPDDNPFDNPVFSYGHRNCQGLAWDQAGRLWATEHGRSGIQSGLDEVNLIEKGKNYGWPVIEGSKNRAGMETPKLNSGPATTWAPAGASFFDKSLFFAGLRGETLYQAMANGSDINANLKEHFSSQFGRLREVVLGPDNFLYVTTSNQDSRGSPQEGDDKIIKINPSKLL